MGVGRRERPWPAGEFVHASGKKEMKMELVFLRTLSKMGLEATEQCDLCLPLPAWNLN